MPVLIQNAIPIFTDVDGDPLENGFIFIGVANLNPLSNPLQAYWDAELTIPANNIRTKGGYPSNDGTPGRLYIGTNYSILVQDKKSSTVYTQLDSVDYFNSPSGSVIQSVDTISDLRELVPTDTGYTVKVRGYYAAGDIPDIPGYSWQAGSVSDDNGGSIIKPTDIDPGDPGRWEYKLPESIDVRWFGAVADGVTDDTLAVQKAFLTGCNIRWGRANYVISDSLALSSNMTIDSSGSIIIWAGDTVTNLYEAIPILGLATEEVHITGGLYTGSPASWIYLEGLTASPVGSSDFARNIFLDSVDVSGAVIFMDCQKAVRKVFISGCDVFTENGINGEGKIVEFKIVNSIIFGSTGLAGTYGIKTVLHPDAVATAGFSEGFHVASCTLDNFDKTINMTAIFVAEFTNCFIGKYLNGSVPITFARADNTQCKDINFSNNTISGGLEIGPSSAGYEYEVNITGNIFVQGQGVQINLKGNSADAVIVGNTFSASAIPGSTIGVLLENNVSQVTVRTNRFDSTHLRAVSATGANGAQLSIADNDTLIAVPLFLERPANNKNNGEVNDIASVELTGVAITAGNAFAGTLGITAAKGEKYIATVSLNLTNTVAGRLAFGLPAELEIPSGAGWSAAFFNVAVEAVDKNYAISFPVYCNTDVVGGLVAVSNTDAGSVTLTSHSNMSMIKI